jgi:hypothetical protein
MDACTACSRAVDLTSSPLLKRLWEKSRRLVDEPLSPLTKWNVGKCHQNLDQ